MALEQFILFTTDATGLERILRLVQSLLQIVVSVPVLLGSAASFLHERNLKAGDGTSSGGAVYAMATMLMGARDRVNLGRRFFRVFRFIESFHGAHQLYLKLLGSPKVEAAEEKKKEKEEGHTHTHTHKPSKKRRRLDLWFDAFARTFSGMYLFCESATLLDAMDVPGLSVWGPERARQINVEGQRYWFLSLACSVAAALLRMANVTRDIPLPPPTEEEKQGNMGSRLGDKEEEGAEVDEKEKLESLNEERERLRRIVQGRMTQRRVWQRALRDRLVVLGRRAVADSVDLLLPGAIIGWTPLQPATVGVAMCFTTLLTGYDVWLRCGREVAEAAAAKARAADKKTA